jgi:hypothetical protein
MMQLGNPSKVDTPNVDTGLYDGLTTPVVTSCGMKTQTQYNILKGLGLNTPRINTPGINTPGINTPGINTPGINTPDLYTPDLYNPSIDSPGIDTPGIEDHEAPQPNKSKFNKSPFSFTNSSSQNTPYTPTPDSNAIPDGGKTPVVRFKKKSIMGKVASGFKS